MPLEIKPGIAPYWYTPKDYKEDGDQAPRFKLYPLDQMTLLEIMQESSEGKGGEIIPSGHAMDLALRKGLREWDNINDEKGKPLKITAINMRKLPFELIREISYQLVTDAIVTEDERKNS